MRSSARSAVLVASIALAIAITGIILMVSGEHIGHQGGGVGPLEPPDSGMVIFGGVLLAAAILTLTVQAALILSAAHRRWISQFEPGVQRDIRYMEGIALLGAADLGLREINRRTMEHVNAPRLVPRATPESVARNSHYAGAAQLRGSSLREHPDPVQEMLDRSAAIREGSGARDRGL